VCVCVCVYIEIEEGRQRESVRACVCMSRERKIERQVLQCQRQERERRTEISPRLASSIFLRPQCKARFTLRIVLLKALSGSESFRNIAARSPSEIALAVMKLCASSFSDVHRTEGRRSFHTLSCEPK